MDFSLLGPFRVASLPNPCTTKRNRRVASEGCFCEHPGRRDVAFSCSGVKADVRGCRTTYHKEFQQMVTDACDWCDSKLNGGGAFFASGRTILWYGMFHTPIIRSRTVLYIKPSIMETKKAATLPIYFCYALGNIYTPPLLGRLAATTVALHRITFATLCSLKRQSRSSWPHDNSEGSWLLDQTIKLLQHRHVAAFNRIKRTNRGCTPATVGPL